MPADDYTLEARALYRRISREAAQRPVADPNPKWLDDGPTAQWLAHRELVEWGRVRDRLLDGPASPGGADDAADAA